MILARHEMPGIVQKSDCVPEGRLNLGKREIDEKSPMPDIFQPSLRDGLLFFQSQAFHAWLLSSVPPGQSPTIPFRTTPGIALVPKPVVFWRVKTCRLSPDAPFAEIV